VNRSDRRTLLRDHDYRQLLASTTASHFAIQVVQLALTLVAVDHLGVSEFEAGLVVALTFAGSLLVGLPAGAWVDRMRRRTVLIVSDLGRAALLLTVPLAGWAGLLTIWQLYAVALVHGILTVFFDVAYRSYLPHMVGRDNLVEANASLEAVGQTIHIAAPAVAGQLIRLFTAPAVLVVNALTMAASALFIARIRRREARPARSASARLLPEVAEGVRLVLGHRLLRPIAIASTTLNLFLSVSGAMQVFFLRRVLEAGPVTIGGVFSALGIGGLAGALTARRIAGRVGQGRAIWMAAAFPAPFGLFLPLAELGWRLWLGVAGAALAWGGVVVYNVIQVSVRQAMTPERLLGRMNATMRFMTWGVVPIGSVLGAALGEWLGARAALVVGVLGTCLAFLPLVLSPLRTMRTPQVLGA
jgi:predicted MFS family arabinose efflux permease